MGQSVGADQFTILMAFNLALGVAGVLFGWVLKSITDRIKALEQSDKDMTAALTGLAISLPTHYVAKTEFSPALDAIHAAIRTAAAEQREAMIRLENKLDKKADKT